MGGGLARLAALLLALLSCTTNGGAQLDAAVPPAALEPVVPLVLQHERLDPSEVQVQPEGLTVEEAADRFSVTVRTVFRIMRRCREAAPELDGATLRAFAVM